MRRAKVLVLADPANPTGACFNIEELDHLVGLAAKHDVLVFADESFGGFRPEAGRSLATLTGGDKRVLTAGSLSQGWGLGSVRVGWLAGPRHLVQACALTANLHAPYVPTLCQQIAARAIAEPLEARAKTSSRNGSTPSIGCAASGWNPSGRPEVISCG